MHSTTLGVAERTALSEASEAGRVDDIVSVLDAVERREPLIEGDRQACLHLLLTTPALEAVGVFMERVVCAKKVPYDLLRRYAAVLARSQSLETLLSVVEIFGDQRACEYLLLCWIQEAVLRGADLSDTHAVQHFVSGQLSASSNPLAALPLAKHPIEELVRMPTEDRYSITLHLPFGPLPAKERKRRGAGNTTGAAQNLQEAKGRAARELSTSTGGKGSGNTQQLPVVGGGAGEKGRSINTRCSEISAVWERKFVREAFEGIEGGGGRVAFYLYHSNMFLKSNNVTARLLVESAAVPCLDALAQLDDLELREITPANAVQVLFAATAYGDMFGAHFEAAMGRFQTRRAVAALVGSAQDPFEAAAASHFYFFDADTPFFFRDHFDAGLVCLRPDGRTFAVLAFSKPNSGNAAVVSWDPLKIQPTVLGDPFKPTLDEWSGKNLVHLRSVPFV